MELLAFAAVGFCASVLLMFLGNGVSLLWPPKSEPQIAEWMDRRRRL